MQATAYYLHVLKTSLSQRQKVNPHYSLRAFARDIDVHPSTLSQIIKGSRPLPLKDSSKVAGRLGLGPKERTLFLESLFKIKTKLDLIPVDQNDDRFMLDESYFKVISEWEHYAVLTLFNIQDFKPSTTEITKKLDMTPTRAEVVLNNLLTCGLLKKDEKGILVKSQSRVRTTEDIDSLALKQSHKETLEMGIKKLEEIEVELRDFSAINVAIDLRKLTEAKTIIREFRQKMASLLRDGNKTDVYQLAIQFYPLTQINTKQRKLYESK